MCVKDMAERWGLVATLYEGGAPISTILEESGYANKKTIWRIVDEVGLEKRPSGRPRSRDFNERVFEKIDSAESAYWLGFVTTDGHIKHGRVGNGRLYYVLSFRLAHEDGDRVEAFADFVGADAESIFTLAPQGRQKQPAACLALNSKILTQSLIDLGCKSNDKLASKIEPPRGFEADFWRGVFDADGYVSNMKGALRVAGIVSSRHLVEGLRDFAKENGVRSKSAIYENQGGLGRAVQWKCFGQDATRLRDALYPNGNECEHLIRKKVLLDKVAETYPL